MSVSSLIPTCDDLMSVYTLISLTVIVGANITIDVIVVKWVLNEFRTLRAAINGHDDYIDATNNVINQIHIDLAVQESSMKDLKDDIAEIKADIKILLNR
jgi:hypothetical protein